MADPCGLASLRVRVSLIKAKKDLACLVLFLMFKVVWKFLFLCDPVSRLWKGSSLPPSTPVPLILATRRVPLPFSGRSTAALTLR